MNGQVQAVQKANGVPGGVHSVPEAGVQASERPIREGPEGDALLTVKGLARFLSISERQVFEVSRRDPWEVGSIPMVVLPSRGRRRQIRFIREDVIAWSRLGCPAAADFERLRMAGRGGRT